MIVILNDTHIGASRQAGTTPQSQEDLREYIFDTFEHLVLEKYRGNHIIINGDLFDGFTVDERDFIRLFQILVESVENGTRFTFIMGNHDANARGDKVSSFHMLTDILYSGWSQVRVDHRDGFIGIAPDVYAISHCMNQELFNLELEKAAAVNGTGQFLLLHCNIKNHFAEEADHSLNLNDDQLSALMKAGWTIICGHEHQMRVMRNGRVIVPGNQIPTSVADWLGCDGKYLVTIEDGKAELVTLQPNALAQVEWTALADTPANAPFVRVIGSATSEQASQVIDAIAALRRTHDAFVITNAVKIEGMVEMDALAEMSMEDITNFNVLDALMEELDDKEQVVVKDLLAD